MQPGKFPRAYAIDGWRIEPIIPGMSKPKKSTLRGRPPIKRPAIDRPRNRSLKISDRDYRLFFQAADQRGQTWTEWMLAAAKDRL